MGLFGKTKAIGLDIGQSSVKAVALELRAKQAVLVDSNTLDARAEGILSEAELRSSVAEWLAQIGWAQGEMSVGLPQYLATTQVSDFPPGTSAGLDEMVAYETRQLAGLSEESFMHDYQVMEPKFGRRNPALIGICRESAVRERSDALGSAGIHLVDMAMNGTAVATAFFEFNPAAVDVAEPQLVLDIGAGSSTMLVAAAGQILFVGSLLFGAEKYTQALSKHLGTSEEEAEKTKTSARLNATDTGSPLYQCTQQLEAELRVAVENWRSQERPEIGNKMFAKVWLCGGGARLAGLADHFARTYGCPAEVFGPRPTGSEQREPDLVTAYGLALQGLGHGRVLISLCPPEVKWFVHRQRRFGYLIAAAAVVALLVVGLMFRTYRRMNAEQAAMEDRIEDLRNCEALIPRLEDTNGAIEHHEKMVVPFVEKGNRARRFLAAVAELDRARGKDDWFVYLADAGSFQRGKKKPEGAPEPPAPAPAAPDRPTMGPLLAPPPGGRPGESGTRASSSFPGATNVLDIEQWRFLIAGVYTPLIAGSPWDLVGEIIRKLEPAKGDGATEDETEAEDTTPGLFGNVDLLPKAEETGREDIFEDWEKFLALLARGDPSARKYKAFMLQLPFANLDVNKANTSSDGDDEK